MNTAQAATLGKEIAAHIAQGDMQRALKHLAPTLAAKTPFAMLDRIGAQIGTGEIESTNAFLDELAQDGALGVWAILGSALTQQLERDFRGALKRGRAFTIHGDVWYACDALGERVLGRAWVAKFEKTRQATRDWRFDENRWVRRSIGVGIHVWAKRSRGEAKHNAQANDLFEFLAPMFCEREMDAVKGIGWALKTLGKFYPARATEWLGEMVARESDYRALMLRKATTYLNQTQRAEIYRAAS
ncbi:MAG: DNA alkylation repair protein [Chloroflexi bacterium]|nr:DNA alkylation repair protein [Chloroflexota bacterium]